MSMYGPQGGGGPYRGQPDDPYDDGSYRSDPHPADPQHDDPYRDFPDQWGASRDEPLSYDRSGYQSGYTHSDADNGYGRRDDPGSTGEEWGPAQAPARRGGSGTVVGIVIVVVLVLLGGVGIGAFLVTRDDDRSPAAGPTTAPTLDTAPGTPSAVPSSTAAAPSSAPPSSPAAPANEEARTAKVGECLVNKGTATAPDMRKVACAVNTYQVLKRIDGTSDKARCDGTATLTDWYFYDHSDNTQDFVLCLRKR